MISKKDLILLLTNSNFMIELDRINNKNRIYLDIIKYKLK